MARPLPATPLIALDAVVLDLETTGLDVRSARIVQVGAVRLSEGHAAEDGALSLLVDPGEPIPPASTAIHGVGNDAVAGAPGPSEALAQIAAFAGERIVIGHTIGFDLAVLKAESARAGAPWKRPRSLDTRVLAQVANPDLPGFGMEVIAGWLGVRLRDRHSAIGDALTTADLFLALIPHLRDRGIRTLAEAEAACKRLADAAAAQPGGWEEPVVAPRAERERGLARIDSYPYRHRIADVMTSPVLFGEAAMPLVQAARQMADQRISSLILPDEGEGYGIVTERDVLRAIARDGAAALDRPVGAIATRPLRTVPAEAFIYRAVGRMNRLKVRHLGVRDEAGALVGAISARDLLRLRATEAISLGDAIDDARNVAALAAAWARLPAVAESLVAEDVDARAIAGVISRELGAATRQAAVLAEAKLRQEGLGDPPVPYALLVLGSAGRGESLLALDQDNAIVFAEGEPDGPEDRYFARLGAEIADALHAIAVPYCKGGVMARNPAWRGSLATWHGRVASWLERSRPEDLLSVDIFFDLRAVHGESGLAHRLLADAQEGARGSLAFLKLLAEAGGKIHSPFGLFGALRTEDGRLDLKMSGLFPVVTAARILAIRHGIAERSTPRRLEGLRKRQVGAGADLERLVAAHAVLLKRVLAQQIEDIHDGVPPSNKVKVKALGRAEQSELKDALAAIGQVPHIVRDLMF
ncbi:DUF294 nucleotidyltransferase-like domain-containing protein [Faunimonas sp. B44]|uniref:DUF294 nucleotidyltransferase-like domain-containing protein n=1 Tax=Faunimonas sp. B44 TaxID=3461493 RepID=UPI004043E4EB